MPRKQQLLVYAAIALVVGGTFSAVWEADFLNWDDNHNIYENPSVREFNADNLRWMFTDVGPDIRYKPFTWLAWATVDALFGLNPRAFHGFNLLLHLLNTGLLMAVFRALGRRIRPPADAKDERRLFLMAAGAAALWAVHPLRVEPVAWVSCAAHGLCLAFALAATIEFLRTDFERPVWGQGSYWRSLGWMAMGLLSFPLPLGYGAVFLALLVYPLRRVRLDGAGEWRGRETRKAVVDLLPFLGISLAALVVQLYCRLAVRGTFGQAVSLEQFPLMDRLLQSTYVWMFYLWKTLLPIGLSPVYLDLTELSGWDAPFVASAAAVLLLVALAVHLRRRAPGLLALVIAHLGVLVPVLGLTERPHFPGDRYSHIDGAVLVAGLFGWFWWRAERLPHRVWAGGALALGIVLAALSFRQSLIWLDDRTFFTFQTSHLADGGQRGMAFVRLAASYQRAGDLERAAEYYAAALRAHPGYPAIDLFLPYGMALEGLGHPRLAARQYQRAIGIEPGHPEAWKRLGMIFFQQGEVDLAASLWRDAEPIHGRNPELLTRFAEGFLAAGRLDLAGELAARAAVIAPNDPRVQALRARLASEGR